MLPSRDVDPSHEAYLRTRPRRYEGFVRTSRHLKMRDGNEIAVDVCLPRGLGAERLPTVVRQTRYFRRYNVLRALRRLPHENTLDPLNAPMRRMFTERGYAWIDVDVRGSGASFGERPCPWYLDGEVADGAEIVDWIVRQPWSNGRVGSTGVSYDGTTAEFLAITGHPAVKAVAPRFSLFDVYPDVAFPGGLHNAWFTYAWEAANAALDRNVPGDMVATVLMLQLRGQLDERVARRVDRPLVRRALSRLLTFALDGVAPVDGGRDRLAAALASHAENYNVHDGAVDVTFRDDSPKSSPIAGSTSDYFSPHSYVDRLRDVAVLGYGGFFDGAYGRAMVDRHRTLAAMGKDSHLLLGPWIHGGQLDLDPDAPGHATRFDHATELLRFFDRYLVPELSAERPRERVRYYLMGEGAWKTAEAWPPPGARDHVLHLDARGRLAPSPTEGTVEVTLSTSVGAGPRSRHRTLLCPFLVADNRGRSPSGYASFETAPFDHDVDLVGSPILELACTSSSRDHALVVYLEDLGASPRVLTEGVLRTIHGTRLVHDGDAPPRVHATFLRNDAYTTGPHAIELLPVAMRIRRGHRLRLVLGAADVDHFTTPPGPAEITLRIDPRETRLHLPTL